MSVRATSNPTRTRSRARIVTRSNWSVPVNGGIVWKCRIGLFRRAICSCMREVMLKLTMDYKMIKHMLNNCTLKESRTWLLVCTRHCYFIPFNREHPVHQPFLSPCVNECCQSDSAFTNMIKLVRVYSFSLSLYCEMLINCITTILVGNMLQRTCAARVRCVRNQGRRHEVLIGGGGGRFIGTQTHLPVPPLTC